jgi:putative endopeptidase
MRVSLFFLLAGVCLAQKFTGFDPGSLDRKTDPCGNFYRYACGGWMAANPVPADRSRWGRFDELQEHNRVVLQSILENAIIDKPGRSVVEREIGDFYYACLDQKAIDERGLSALTAELDRIDGMRNKAAITAVVARMYRAGSAPFFHFSSSQDPKDSTRMIGDLDQGGLGLPDRDYYLKTDQKSVQLRAQYAAHLGRMFQLMGNSPDVASKKAEAVIALETALAKGSLDVVSRRDPNKLYHLMTVGELSTLAPGFAWPEFFTAAGAPPFDQLNVDVPDFVKALEGVLSGTTLDDLKTYLISQLLNDLAGNLPLRFQEENFDFFGKTLRGAKQMQARWKRCVDQVDSQLPDALGQKFVEKVLGPEGIRRTRELVGEIEKAMAADLQSIDWMSPKTKEQAMIKLHAVMNKIGSKQNWIDYSTVKIARDDALGNAERSNEFELHRQLAKIGKPVDKTEWQMSPPTVNAYYDPQQNDINFPAGILEPPFWDSKMDDAVNYGAIGAVIGHELTHGFDDQGRQYDAQGNLRDWWTEQDAKNFDQRAQCLVKEYSSFTAVDDAHVNGELTLGENTADNGGLRLAYMALLDSLNGKTPPKRDGFTAQQRFFLGWAQIWCENSTPESARVRVQVDPHSPGEDRVNGVVSNMPEFQQAFACRTGQLMVRYPACRVW